MEMFSAFTTSTMWPLAIFGIASVLLFYFMDNRTQQRKYQEQLQAKNRTLNKQLLTAQRLYLETLRRELANLIINDSVETFEKAFERTHYWEEEMVRTDDRDHQLAEYDLMLKRFSSQEDFDLIGTRHFIRYNNSPMWEIDDLVERYKDISKFLALELMLDKSSHMLYDEKEVDVFRKEMQRAKDQRLKIAIEEAMARYYSSGKGRLGNDETYNDDQYEVFSLRRYPNSEFTPEIKYGVHCKKLDEYAIYSFFAGDDKTYYSFYRTTQSFTEDHLLMT
jgi:hypothetical protein